MIPLSSHWSASLPVLATYAVVAGAHLLGLRRMSGSRVSGSRLPDDRVREALAFHGGLLAVLLALVSPIGYWSQHVIWVRSVQDLLLANVAPGLVVLGAPWDALRRAVSRRAGSPAADRPAAAGVRWSLAAVVLFALVWCAWHLPFLYDAVLGHPVVYAAEVVSYLGLGVLFWLQLIGSRPLSPSLPPLHRVMVLTGTVTVGTILAMVLVFGSRVVYHGYLSSPHPVMSVLADQQVAGGVLWVLMLPAYLLTGVSLLMRWLGDEESQAKALTSGLDQLLTPGKPGKPAWPSRPGLR